MVHFGGRSVSSNDLSRREAVQLYDKEGPLTAGASLNQGIALLCSMVAAQILSRVSRLSFRDVVALRFTVYEALAAGCSVALLASASISAAVPTDSFEAQTTVSLFLFFLSFILPTILWRIVVAVEAERVRCRTLQQTGPLSHPSHSVPSIILRLPLPP